MVTRETEDINSIFDQLYTFPCDFVLLYLPVRWLSISMTKSEYGWRAKCPPLFI